MITDTLSSAIVGGLNDFIIGMADSFYESSYRPGNNTMINGTASEVLIYGITTYTCDPWASPGIKDIRLTTILLYIIYCSLYSSVGGIYVIVSTLTSRGGDIMDTMLNRSSSFRTVRIKEHFENLLVSIGALAFTDIFIRAMFTINYFLVSLFMVSCFEMKSLSPSTDNVILYFWVAMFYHTMFNIMQLRHILLYIFVMGSFIIGMLLISNRTRNIGISIGYYFTGILFLQSIIVFLTTAGFISVEILCANRGIVMGSATEIAMYFLVLVLLVLASLSVIIGLVRLRKTAVKTVRLVI